MKLLPKVLCINIALIGIVAGMSASATLLTFDSLPTGALPAPGYGVIPNGYGGLNWNNFGVLNGSVMDPSYGYHTGMVSPNNVAFNLYGDPASITTSRGLFNLNSAYLTLALNLPTPLEIQVQGYLGAALLYNQTYVVNSSGPTFVNFNYDGVNKVTFTSIPGQPFAMDNLGVTVPDASNTMVLLGLTAVGLAILERSCKKQHERAAV